MKVVIIEDEPLAAQKLADIILDINPQISIETVLPSVKASISWFMDNPLPDLVFSDIQVADGLSFEIFKQIDLDCPVIFTTAYDQYAIEAFEVNSVDYLLKPVKPKKLAASLEKFTMMRSAFSQQETRSRMEELMDMVRSGNAGFKSRFLVKNGNRIRAVKIGEVAYFFSEDKVNMLMTRDQEKFPLDYSLDEIGQMVDPRMFFRINRKYLIHIDAAQEIHPYFKGRLKLELFPQVEEDVVISSEKTPLFKVWLDQ